MGLFFTAPYVSMDMVSNVLLNKMNVNCNDIIGVQNLNRNKVVVKFGSTEGFMNIMEEFEDKMIKINEVEMVRIVNLSNSFTFVSIRNAPFEMDDDLIVGILSRYGKVDSIRKNTFSLGPFKGLLSGIRTVKMKIKGNIPSSLNVCGHNLTVLYNGQKRTCFKCGQEGHLMKDCAVDIFGKENAWSEEDFPRLDKRSEDKNRSEGETRD